MIRNASRWCAVLIVFFFAGWLTSVACLAGENTVVVAVDDYPPWKIIVGDDRVEGLDMAMLREVLKPLGLEETFSICPWLRCLKMMEAGEADMITGVVRRPQREAYLHFIEPPYKTTSTKAFYYLKGSGHDIRTYEDLYRLEIATVRGAKYFEPFDSDPRIKKHVVTRDQQSFQMLKANRIDAMVGTESYLDYLIAIEGHTKVEKATFKYDREVSVYFAVSKKSPFASSLDQFNERVRQLVDDGTFDALINQFYSHLGPSSEE